MSTGDTPPTPRFTSPSSNNNPPKKYPGTPKSPLTTNSTTGNNRNLLARQRLLSGKVSAPRPINLPSLRKEHAVGTEVLSSSPSTTSHGWGSSTSSSPSNSFTQPSELENKAKSTDQSTLSPTLDPTENPVKIDLKSNKSNSPTKADLASSPPPQSSTTTTRAWAIPAKTQASVQSPSTDFPTAAEAANKKKSSVYDDKEYLKYASSDPNHTSWDEMVSEDLDEEFSVDVVEFDDGTKVQIEGTEESVNPSDRFTEDYDRSYPPKTTTHHNNDMMDHHSSNYKPNYRRSEDHGYNNPRYNNSVHGYDNRRHSSSTTNDRWNNNSNNHRRRESTDSNGNTNRRASYDKKSSGSVSTGPPSSHHNNNTPSYHPTLLQRPRRLSEQSFRSDHSREDAFHVEHHTNPLQIIPEPSTSTTSVPPVTEEITAAQREVMLTAAERAKKRRDEEEAEFEAARIRARQKADALAEKARLDAVKKEKDSPKEEKSEPTKPPEKSEPTKPSEKKPSKEAKTVLKKKDSSPEPTTPPRTSSIIDTSKPWNLVAANKKITIEKRPKTETTAEKDKETKEPEKSEPPKEIEPPKFDKDGKPLTEDEQNWEMYVSRVKSDTVKPVRKSEVTSNDWASFATRLQQSVVDNQKAFEAKHKATLGEKQKETVVEEIQYNEMEKSDASHHNNNKGQNRGWTRNEDEHGGYNLGERSARGRGSSDRSTRGSRNTQGVNRRQPETVHWRQTNDNSEQEKEPVPVITEILKHEPVVNTPSNISKKSRLTNLLKESVSPIFPDAIQKLVGKKPANISFMIDVDESDKDITMMDVLVKEDKKEESVNEVQSDLDVKEDPIVEVSTADKPFVSTLESSSAPESTDKSSVAKSLESTSAPESLEVSSAVETLDETSATSSTASTPPRAQFQDNQNKLDSSSPQRLNANPNYPMLVYQYPVSQQQQQQQDQHNSTSGYSNAYSSRPKGYQQQQQHQRPMGVYLMPPQQYMTGNQYLVSYPQGGAGVQPMYYPTMSWPSQYNNNNGSNTSPRPHYDQRRPNNNNNSASNNTANHMSKWEAHTNSIAYQSHRPSYNNSNYRGGYRKQRGGYSSNNTRGRGGYNNNHHSSVSRYPDVNTAPPSEQQPPSSEINNL